MSDFGSANEKKIKANQRKINHCVLCIFNLFIWENC